MSDETIVQEHDRLRRRTEELLSETRGLSVEVKPFDKGEHAAHRVRLREHRSDLRAHVARQKIDRL